MKDDMTLEFSRPVAVEEMEPGDEIGRSLEADEAERAALADRMELIALESLSVEATVRRLSGGPLYRVRGQLLADVVQSCVVTLDPVPGRVEAEFDELYAAEGYEPPEEEEGAELPEFFDGHAIDLGELAAQILLLSLDPYPRAPGAELALKNVSKEDVSDRRRPFEGLAEMLKGRK
jgi:uncharacterized metal-binding protein YceD (DUF177 family)